MRWLLGTLFVGGCGLLWFGNKAMNDPDQSADVRVGGVIPAFIGGCMLVLDVLLALIWLVMRA